MHFVFFAKKQAVWGSKAVSLHPDRFSDAGSVCLGLNVVDMAHNTTWWGILEFRSVFLCLQYFLFASLREKEINQGQNSTVGVACEQGRQLNVSEGTKYMPSVLTSCSGRQPLSLFKLAAALRGCGVWSGWGLLSIYRGWIENLIKATSVTPLYTRARLSFRRMEEGAERCPGRPRERYGQ